MAGGGRVIEMAGMRNTRRIGVVLREGFDLRTFANISETLRVANRWLDGERYLCDLIGVDRVSAISHFNGDFRISALVGERIDYELIVLTDEDCSIWKEAPMLRGWLRRAQRFGVELGAVGLANWALAAFALNGGAALSVPMKAQAAFRETFGGMSISTSPVTVSKGIISADVPARAGTMILQWLRHRHGDQITAQIAADLGMDCCGVDLPEQRLNLARRLQITHPALETCINLMEGNLEDPLSQGDLARATGLSRRQLERVFSDKLGTTPRVFYRNLRLHRARQLLLQTSLSVTEVGIATGFISNSHFSRVFKTEFGATPNQIRKSSVQERKFRLALTLN